MYHGGAAGPESGVPAHCRAQPRGGTNAHVLNASRRLQSYSPAALLHFKSNYQAVVHVRERPLNDGRQEYSRKLSSGELDLDRSFRAAPQNAFNGVK